ncbi:MAG: circularly permuted type 2 ATP-grasp protein [Azospirillum sp.]|nr:circularly permuted type 2 ATP-grasp protein [Azospirillum sp.]
MNETTPIADALAAAAAASPYDEMVTGGGQIRFHWQAIMGALRTLPPGALAERMERARRQYDENGVTYNVFADAAGAARPWQFDLIPLPIPADEWEEIEVALAKRATLLDRVLADLYGPQNLLKERLLPPALVHANPGFLRPCHGIVPANGAPFVHFYAADLARGEDGKWRVCADRVNAPSGAGYALENRNVLMRTLPELFQAGHVRRLGPFFELWQSALAALAPRHRENPRIVLLTPGPYSETYFEHVYLARQLGLTLAEGADLTVREGKCYLKTLGGLQQVDVILRRMDADYCDPVELRAESAIGVAGLLDAVRAGNVTVANALGAGAVETPAIMPFLPGLARRLLDDDLDMPSIETWWLGQSAVFADVAKRIEDYVIRPAFAGDPEPATVGATLDARRRAALVERIAERPWRYVAQARLRRSSMPVWTPTGLQPRTTMVRAFLVRHEGGYVPMPGGMTRVGNDEDGVDISMQRGGASKDTWVVVREPQTTVVGLRASAGREPLRRSSGELQSRVADNLFWLGRYAERLDDTARLMRACLMRAPAGDVSAREVAEFQALMRMLAARGAVERRAGGLPDSRAMMEALATACGPDQGISHLFQAIQRIAPTVRDRLSADMWKVVNDLLRDARLRLEGRPGDVDWLFEGVDHVISVCAAFHGMASENMTRGSGWRFLDLGRRIERASYATAMVRDVLAAAGAQGGEAWLRLMLELADSSITYRTRYMAAIQLAPVVDLVVCDETNPRSIGYQLQTVAHHLDALPQRASRPLSLPEQKVARGVLSAIELFDVERLSSLVDREATAALDGLMVSTAARLADLSEAITRAYFSHVTTVRSIGYETMASPDGAV